MPFKKTVIVKKKKEKKSHGGVVTPKHRSMGGGFILTRIPGHVIVRLWPILNRRRGYHQREEEMFFLFHSLSVVSICHGHHVTC